jgi:hypothetical protein
MGDRQFIQAQQDHAVLVEPVAKDQFPEILVRGQNDSFRVLRLSELIGIRSSRLCLSRMEHVMLLAAEPGDKRKGQVFVRKDLYGPLGCLPVDRFVHGHHGRGIEHGRADVLGP